MNKKNTPLVLCIMDGYGINKPYDGNAVYLAKKPNIDKLLAEYPNIELHAGGPEVGLPKGQMGNSEVGHITIGAGRIVYQSLTLVSSAIVSKTFFKNEALLKAIEHANKNNSVLHLMGLVSDGGVHSHIDHLYACLELAKAHNVKQISIHAYLDGRDVDYNSGSKYIQDLLNHLQNYPNAKIATIAGRFFAMDRDKRWERIDETLSAMIDGSTLKFSNPIEYIENSYKQNEFDEFVRPASAIDAKLIQNNDAIIFFNFRPDRAIQIASVISNENYEHQYKVSRKNLCFASMLPYSNTVIGPVAFRNAEVPNTLGYILEQRGYSQLRIAETEKYAHVTYFFDGGVKVDYPHKKQILIASPKVKTYDMQPEMSADEVTNQLLNTIESVDVVILNFANCDMVGHTGKVPAAIKAVEKVDECIGKIYAKVKSLNGIMLITADHGNADYMIDDKGMPVTSHSKNPVPFIITSNKYEFVKKIGTLGDIAPTMLHILKENIPSDMTGNVLIKDK